jgi:hypothetical protein
MQLSASCFLFLSNEKDTPDQLLLSCIQYDIEGAAIFKWVFGLCEGIL